MPTTKKPTSTRRSVKRAPAVTRPATITRPAPIAPQRDRGLVWDTLAKMFVALSFFLTPVLITTHLSDSWEQPKTLILVVLVGLAWIFALIAMMRRRQVQWTWHKLDWAVVGLVVATALSSWLSVSPMRGLWGIGGWSSGTLPATIGFASVYFLTTHLFRNRHDRLLAWTSLLTGTGAAVLIMIFQFSDVPLTPTLQSFGQLTGTIANSANQAAIVAAVFGTIVLLLWSAARERWAQLGIIAGLVASWLVVLFLRQPIGWAVFALGMMAVVIDQSMRKAGSSRVVGLAVAAAALGILLQLTGAVNHAGLPKAGDVVLDQSTTMHTAVTTLAHHPLLGSGPSTWYDDFVQYRPQAFTTSPAWSLRFIRAQSQWWELLATGGIVMTVLWLGFLGLAAWWLWRSAGHPLSRTIALLLIAVTFITGFFSVWSWVLLLWLWAAIGLSRADLDEAAPPTVIGSMVPIGLLVAVVALGWYGWSAGRATASDIQFVRARDMYSQAKPIDDVLSTLASSVRLNPKNANAYILYGNAEVTKAQLNVQTNPQGDITALIQSAVHHLKQSISADPKNPATYEETNNLLNRLSGVVSDVATEAYQNFLQLEKLEPANPIHDVGEGQTLMVLRANLTADQTTTAGTSQKQAYLDQALTAYRRALSKKPDYVQAQFALAQALDVNNQSQNALDILVQAQSALGQVGQYWAVRAVTELHLKNATAADADFTQAILLSKTDASIYGIYADALVTAGNKTKAKTILQQGLIAIPDSGPLQQQLDQIK